MRRSVLSQNIPEEPTIFNMAECLIELNQQLESKKLDIKIRLKRECMCISRDYRII